MQKWFFLLLCPLLLQAQNENEKSKQQRLDLKIKEIFLYEENLKTGDTTLARQEIFNTEGNYIEVKHYARGIYNGRYVHKHDNEKLTETLYGYDPKESLYTVITRFYDKKGNQIADTQARPDGTISVHQKREYNSKNQVTKLYTKIISIGIDEFFLNARYLYRKDGQYSKKQTFIPGGSMASEAEYIYNDNNQLMSVYLVKEKQTEVSFKYNEQNLLAERYIPKTVDVVRNGVSQFSKKSKKITYTYDAEGKKIAELEYENDVLVKSLKYRYVKFQSE